MDTRPLCRMARHGPWRHIHWPYLVPAMRHTVRATRGIDAGRWRCAKLQVADPLHPEGEDCGVARIAARRVIRAPIERVFRLATQAERLPEWNPFFSTVTRVSGPPEGPPVAFDAVMNVAGRQIAMHHLVTSVRPPVAITINGMALEGGRLTWVRRFNPAGDGETVLESEIDYELPKHFAEAGGDPFPEQAIARDLIRAVDGLAALAEATASRRASEGRTREKHVLQVHWDRGVEASARVVGGPRVRLPS